MKHILSKTRLQHGSFVIFFVMALTTLISCVALVIDGARMMISVTKSKQLSEQAATFAIRDYVTYLPENYLSLTDAQIHDERMNHAKKAVAALLNDELNSVFGNQSAKRVEVDEEGLPSEGLELTPGEYFSDSSQISDSALKTQCQSQEAATQRLGCWVPFVNDGNGGTYHTGVNSFYSVVKTPQNSAIQTLLLNVVGSQSFLIRNEAYSYLRPRYFLNAVDLSESITEGNFNSTGRQRSKFMFKFAPGSGASSGTDCITDPSLSPTTPACSFLVEDGGMVLNPQDDQTWNGEFYSNPSAVPDGRCTGSGSPCGVVTESVYACENVPPDPTLDLTMPSRSGYTLAYDSRYQRAFIGRWPTPFQAVPGCSPIFWSENALDYRICNRSGHGEPNNPHSCFADWAFDFYGYRYLGDNRSENGGLTYVPFHKKFYPDPSHPEVYYEFNGNVARQPHFKRYKSDYLGVNLSNLNRARIDDTTGNIESRTDTDSLISGQYLYEDPQYLRQYTYGDSATEEETGRNTRSDTGEALTTDDKPIGYFMFDERNYEYDKPRGANTFPVGNNIDSRGPWVRGRGYFLPRRAPVYDGQSSYEGPEPYNSILKGLWAIHDIIAQQKVPGDRFGALFFDSALLSEKAQIPLTKVILGDPKTTTVSADQQKLKDLLNAIDPRGNDFWQSGSGGKIEARLRLGLFPDPTASNTNISFGITSALQYLKGVPNFKGADVYLNLYTDFVAFAHCRLIAAGSGNKLTPAQITACAQTPANGTHNDTTKHVPLDPPRAMPVINNDPNNPWGLPNGAPDPRYGPSWEPERQFLGMLNDLIGWPTDGNADVGNAMDTDYPRKQGLIDYLKQEGITPIFFAFNGTVGGELIYPSKSQGGGCMSRTEARATKDANNLPIPLVRTRRALWWDGHLLTQLHEYRSDGSNGMLYLYPLGDMAKPLLSAGGQLIQLLPPCQNLTVESSLAVNPSAVGHLTAQQRLNAMCNKSPNQGKTNGSGAPLPLDLYAANEDGNFFSTPWSNDTNWRSWASWRRQNGWNAVIWFGHFQGATMWNPLYDLGVKDNWYYAQDNGTTEYAFQSGFATFHEPKGMIFHQVNFTTESPPIEVSDMGGLRCEPRTDPNNPRKPYGIDLQMKEVVSDIIRQPRTLVVSEPNRIE